METIAIRGTHVDASADERRIIRQLDLRILLPLCFPFFFSLIDRLNLAIAALQMNSVLSIGATMFGLATGIFFIGYALSGIPGNLLAIRVGAARWMAITIVVWGSVSMLLAGVQSSTQLVALRFALGLAEGGFVPALLVWLGQWYPDRARGRAISLLVVPQCAATLLSGPIGGWLMGAHPTDGWRIVFLAEGVPAVVIGLLWFRMPDRPEQARWLGESSRNYLLGVLAHEAKQKRNFGGPNAFMTAAKSPALWVFCLTWICVQGALNGMVSWLPQIISADFKGRLTSVDIGLLTSLPSLIGIVCALIASVTLTKTADRRYHLAVMLLTALVCVVATTQTDSPIIGVALISLALGASFPVTGAFWSVPLSIFEGVAAAGAVAMINTIGILGGFVVPPLMGYLRTVTGSFEAPILVPAGAYLIAGIIPLLFKRYFEVREQPSSSRE